MKERNPPNNFTGLWVYECPTGIVYESEYVYGIEHGVYRKKLPSGIVIREGLKHDGLDHGQVKIFDSEGNEVCTYIFEHGTGTHLIYTTSGDLGWEIPYKNGLQHGSKRHYINGNVVSEQNYCSGKKI